MATHRKEKPDLWADLLTLANNDDTLMRAAALAATDAQGRVNLKTVRRNILSSANPALLATLEAACEFARDVACQEKLADLPHLQAVYEMATKDTSAPSRIFNEAAHDVRSGKDIPNAIHTAIAAQTMRCAFH